MNSATHQPTFLPLAVSEHLILIAFACSLVIHLGVAAFKLDWLPEPKEKPKPITVELIKKPAPVVAPPPPVKPKPIIKPKKKVTPKPKKKVIKKRKPVVKKVVKPAIIPTPSPVVVPEPVYEPLPELAPTPEPIIEPLPEPVVPTPAPVVKTAPPPPTGPTASELEAAKGQYKRMLLAAMNRHKKYPRIAKSRGWQGKVIIQFNLDRNGNILTKSVVQSSGHKSLDKAAIKMAEKAAPFPKPPSVLQGDNFNIKVPIPFKLKER